MPVAGSFRSSTTFTTLLILALGAGGARDQAHAAPAPERAPLPEGRATAAAADRALAAGRFREALGLYRRASHEEPARADLACGIGLAHERLGDLPQAHAFLTRCLAVVASAPADAALRRATRSLEDGRYAPVAIDVHPERAELHISPFAADEPLTAPIDLWLPFGTHRFTLRAPGHEEHGGEVVVDSNSRQVVAVTLRRSGSGADRSSTVDFGAGGDGPAVDAPITVPDQRPLRHESLMPGRFRRALGKNAATTPARPTRREPATRPSQVRVLSWNLKRLGHGKKRMDLVARMVATADVAVLQEVMTPAGVQRLLAYLPGWTAAISPRAVGRGGYAEHYAVLYRRDRVSRLRAYTVDDRADQFAREPYVVCLKARAFDFCVITIHVVFGRTVGPRNSEIEALGPLLDRLMRTSRERDWIVTGDFNRPARAGCWSPLEARGWIMTTRASALTSLSARGYSNDYDHLLINPRYTREWTHDGDRLDSVGRLCRGDFAWCIAQVSDHAPIYATFATGGLDDD
jgi:exonuclease III